MSTILLVALASALALLTATEIRVAGNYRMGLATLYGAEAALELAAEDLLAAPDWNSVLGGLGTSRFVDGSPSGQRQTPAGAIDLTTETNIVRCGRPSGCSDGDLVATTSERPWGTNNPVWQVYVSGRLSELLGIDPTVSDMYVVVWVGDDPAECDGRPDLDGASCGGVDNRGAGTIAVRAHAYGPDGAQRAVEARVGRVSPVPGQRRGGILSWREDR